MALRKLMEPGNFQDKTSHAVTPSKEGFRSHFGSRNGTSDGASQRLPLAIALLGLRSRRGSSLGCGPPVLRGSAGADRGR